MYSLYSKHIHILLHIHLLRLLHSLHSLHLLHSLDLFTFITFMTFIAFIAFYYILLHFITFYYICYIDYMYTIYTKNPHPFVTSSSHVFSGLTSLDQRIAFASTGGGPGLGVGGCFVKCHPFLDVSSGGRHFQVDVAALIQYFFWCIKFKGWGSCLFFST